MENRFDWEENGDAVEIEEIVHRRRPKGLIESLSILHIT